MSWMPSRDDIGFLVAIAAVATAVSVIIAADQLPVPIENIIEITGMLSLTEIGVLIAVVLMFLVVVRLFGGVSVGLDRSEITDPAPEDTSENIVGKPTSALGSAYSETLSLFESTEVVDRRVAMYGRRAGENEVLPAAYTRFFDETAVTARDAYATASSETIEAAEKAVAMGTWTDDRIAAAFLASELDAAPSFTFRERITAWVAPRKTFESRFERTVAEIEEHADAYLTYSEPHQEMQRHTGPDAEEVDI